VSATEVADPAVVGLLAAGVNTRKPAGFLDSAGTRQAGAVRVLERHHHHPGVVGLLTPRILLAVDGMNLLKIQLEAPDPAGRTPGGSLRPAHYNDDGGKSSVCSGFHRRKDLDLTMPNTSVRTAAFTGVSAGLRTAVERAQRPSMCDMLLTSRRAWLRTKGLLVV